MRSSARFYELRNAASDRVQIDPSGSVWVTNSIHTMAPGAGYEGGDGLVELIGLAAPVRTPLIGPPQKP